MSTPEEAPEKATEEAPAEATEDATRKVEEVVKAQAIKTALDNQKFIVVKTVSTSPEISDGIIQETAVFIEPVNKALGYMLIVKVNETNKDNDLGNQLSQISAKNKEFTIQINENTTVIHTKITIKVNNGTDTKSVNIYTLKNFTMTGGYNVDVNSEIFVLEVDRQKTTTTEVLKAGISFGYTTIQKQRMDALEKSIYDALTKLIGANNTEFSGDTLALRQTYNLIFKTKDNSKIDAAKNSIKKYIPTPPTSPTPPTPPAFVFPPNIEDDTLIRDIKEYRSILRIGDEPFKLPHRKVSVERTGILKKFPTTDFPPDYKALRNKYILYYELLFAIVSAWKQAPIKDSIITGMSDTEKKTYNEKMAYLSEVISSLPREESILNPVKYGARFNMFNRGGASIASVKYNDRRHKVHYDDEGERFIRMDKKAYKLKESSKGLYITVNGKRDYVK